MSNLGLKGVDIRQTGGSLVFRAFLLASNAVLTTGTTNLRLFELQSDGTLKTFDWSTGTFVTTTVVTLNATMNYQLVNNGANNSGIWTYAMSGSPLAGFTTGAIYFAYVANSLSDTPIQVREFQYGSAEGDLVVTSTGTGTAQIQASPDSIIRSQLTETYAAKGVAPTIEQLLFLLMQSLHEFDVTSGVRTARKLDGTSIAATFQLNNTIQPTATARAT